MRATTFALLGLLVACNLAWYAAWRSRGDVDVRGPERERLEEEVARLSARLAEVEARPADTPDVRGTSPEAPSLQGRDDARAVQAEQRARDEERRTAARREAEAARRRQAEADQQTLDRIRKQIQQIRDPRLREEGLQAVVALLAGDDPRWAGGALQLLIEARDTKLDPTRFRPLILAQLDSPDASVRTRALYALHNIAPEKGDLAYALRAVDDPSPRVRASASHLLHIYSGGTLEGEAAEGVLRLLHQEEPNARKEAMRGIWGATVTPEIQARLVEIAQNPAERSDAVYFGLSTLNNKSREVVAFLVEALQDPNGNISHRARWGLGQGIPEENGAFLAAALAEKLETLADRQTQLEMIALIERHGNADQVSRLRAFADNELASEVARQAAERAIQRLAGR